MNTFNPQDYLSPHLKGLDPYVPGSQPRTTGWTKLNTNELPYPPSPSVKEAIEDECGNLTLYPDPISKRLREAIEKRENLPTGSVIVGNGSDDILNLLARLFGGLQQGVVQTFPSYSLYPVLVSIAGGKLESINFDEQFSLPVESILKSKSGILFLTSPNAPTGIQFPKDQIEALVCGFNGLVVIDEAYVSFAEYSFSYLLKNNPNLIITRTFSKSFGLAGLRVGFGMGNPEVIRLLDSIRDSYNVNRLSQAGALAAYLDSDYYNGVIAKVKGTRSRFCEKLDELGWFYYPTSTNFVFARPRDLTGAEGATVAESLFQFFIDNQVLVRHFANHSLTDAFLRISIGTDDQMDHVLNLIEKWKKNAQ